MTDSRAASSTLPGNAYLARHVAIVFCGCLALGIPLPVLPIFVHDTLGFSATAVGWVIGIESLATVITRHGSGTLADRRGPRLAVLIGLPLAACASLFYIAAAQAPLSDAARLALLLPGRILLGLGESLFLTGAMSWGIGVLGAPRAGRVMAWQGIAIYAAIGLGAPLGLAVHAAGGLTAVSIVTALAPLVGLAIAWPMAGVPATGGGRVPFYRVVSLIWRQGLVLTLATIPFAAMATFIVLDFAAKGWDGAGFALAVFGAAYIFVRLVASHWPDKYGGARVAAWSLGVEAIGQAVLWLAPTPTVALAGALLSGLGFSLIFPAMGVDATHRVPAEMRGRAVGNFIAFFDIALGLTGPLAGLVIARIGYSSIFLIGMVSTLAAVGVLAAGRKREN